MGIVSQDNITIGSVKGRGIIFEPIEFDIEFEITIFVSDTGVLWFECHLIAIYDIVIPVGSHETIVDIDRFYFRESGMLFDEQVRGVDLLCCLFISPYAWSDREMEVFVGLGTVWQLPDMLPDRDKSQFFDLCQCWEKGDILVFKILFYYQHDLITGFFKPFGIIVVWTFLSSPEEKSAASNK
jgi:hypothetical protein